MLALAVFAIIAFFWSVVIVGVSPAKAVVPVVPNTMLALAVFAATLVAISAVFAIIAFFWSVVIVGVSPAKAVVPVVPNTMLALAVFAATLVLEETAASV